MSRVAELGIFTKDVETLFGFLAFGFQCKDLFGYSVVCTTLLTLQCLALDLDRSYNYI